jgi:hypothetical protein
MSIQSGSRLAHALAGLGLVGLSKPGVAVLKSVPDVNQIALAHDLAGLLGYDVVSVDISGHGMVVAMQGGEDTMRADLAKLSDDARPLIVLVDADAYDADDAGHVHALRIATEFARGRQGLDVHTGILATSHDPIAVSSSIGHVLDDYNWSAYIR